MGGITTSVENMLGKVMTSLREINTTTADNVGTIADRLHAASGTLGEMCHSVGDWWRGS